MAMYAIICDGGRQYKVTEGLLVDIDFRETAETGDNIEFDRVLAVGGDSGLKLGQPTLAGAKVTAEVVGLDSEVQSTKELRRSNRSPPKVHAGDD